MKTDSNTKLRQWREEAGFTQEQLAEKIGVARATYSSYEQGRRMPTVYALFALENALGVAGSEIYYSFPQAVDFTIKDEGDELFGGNGQEVFC